MKRSIPVTLIFFLVLACAATWTAAAEWQIDPGHSSATFKVRHLAVSKVSGGFGKVTGTVTIDETDITKSRVTAIIEASSIDTQNDDRDEHLRGADFLEVDKHPTITFRSTSVEKNGENRLKVTGDLTIRGVTQSVVLDVEGPVDPIKDPWGNTKSGASATTRIDRDDFGIRFNKTFEGGGLVVGKEVEISIEVELVEKK